jgi:hypothetical protein
MKHARCHVYFCKFHVKRGELICMTHRHPRPGEPKFPTVDRYRSRIVDVSGCCPNMVANDNGWRS